MKVSVFTTGIMVMAMATAGAASASAGESTGDASRGKTVFARCAACHDLNTGATRLGPSLKGVVGRKSGSFAGFNYSTAMKGKGVSWTPANLDMFLTSPMKYVPGTRMAFAGVPVAQDRADLIAYLQQAAR